MYLEAEVQDYLAARAKARGIEVAQLVNELLKKDIELIEAAREALAAWPRSLVMRSQFASASPAASAGKRQDLTPSRPDPIEPTPSSLTPSSPSSPDDDTGAADTARGVISVRSFSGGVLISVAIVAAEATLADHSRKLPSSAFLVILSATKLATDWPTPAINSAVFS